MYMLYTFNSINIKPLYILNAIFDTINLGIIKSLINDRQCKYNIIQLLVEWTKLEKTK